MTSELLAPPSIATDSLLEIDAGLFRQGFDRRPFVVQHYLADHPLFSLERLVELARRHPPSLVEYNAGNLPLSQDGASTPRNGLSVEETIRRIEECRSWLVLKNVERDGEYGQLLDACLDQVGLQSDTLQPGMCRREGFVFVSSPGSVTPFHIDPEHNFLLQIRGQKQITLFDPHDREVLAEEEIEASFCGAHRNLPYRDDFALRGQAFDLEPGLGLYFPVVAPHFVKNGGEVSISFSITFRTKSTQMREALYRYNHRLRRLGLKPSPVGDSKWRDGFKSGTIRLVRMLRK